MKQTTFIKALLALIAMTVGGGKLCVGSNGRS